jgi:mono/diheme cytochrome c family protein
MSQTAKSGAGEKPVANSKVARGKYLVNNIGMCGDCHTPMDKKGQPIKSQYLQGTVLPFKPTVPIPGFMAVAPGIAGLPAWTEQQGVVFFTTGKKPDGSMAAPPMPEYRFNKTDAAAVVAYLKSLGPDGAGK